MPDFKAMDLLYQRDDARVVVEVERTVYSRERLAHAASPQEVPAAAE